MKKTLIFVLALYLLAFNPGGLSAQEDTDSSEEITENLKQRLQDSLESARQNLITTDNNADSPIAYVGTVLDIVQESAEVQTKDGVRYAKMSEDTTIIRIPGNSVIDLDDIRIDDFIIAMGYQDNETSLNSKRVIVSQTLEPVLQKTSGTGIIVDISSSNITIQKPDGTQLELSLTKSTIVKSTVEVLDIDNLEVDQLIVYTADIDDEDLDATIIMIISPLELEEKDLTNE